MIPIFSRVVLSALDESLIVNKLHRLELKVIQWMMHLSERYMYLYQNCNCNTFLGVESMFKKDTVILCISRG